MTTDDTRPMSVEEARDVLRGYAAAAAGEFCVGRDEWDAVMGECDRALDVLVGINAEPTSGPPPAPPSGRRSLHVCAVSGCGRRHTSRWNLWDKHQWGWLCPDHAAALQAERRTTDDTRPLLPMCREIESNRWHHEPNRPGWHPFVPDSDEPSPWNEDPCAVCGGYMDRPHAHESAPVCANCGAEAHPDTPHYFDHPATIDAERARHAALVAAARLPRNTAIRSGFTSDDGKRFEGEWVAVPRADFAALRAALASEEGG